MRHARLASSVIIRSRLQENAHALDPAASRDQHPDSRSLIRSARGLSRSARGLIRSAAGPDPSTARAHEHGRHRGHQRCSLLHRDSRPVEQRTGPVRPRLYARRQSSSGSGFAAHEGGARRVPLARLCLCRLRLQRPGMGGKGGNRGNRGAAALLHREARRALGNLHHRAFDGRPHHDGHHRALSRGVPGRDAHVRSARGGRRLPEQRPVRHAGHVRGDVPGHDRLTGTSPAPRPEAR